MQCDKNGVEIINIISDKLQLFDSAKFMATLLSNLARIFLNEFLKLNINSDTMIKNVNFVTLDINVAAAFVNTQTLKMS